MSTRVRLVETLASAAESAHVAWVTAETGRQIAASVE